MGKSILAAFAGMFVFLLTSCAPVKFYSDSELTKKSGLKYYSAKPYLQVERDINNNVVKATVIYLPDLTEPMYLVVKDGLGSRKIDVKLTDGTLNTIGIATDPGIDGIIKSLAALISGTSSAVTDLATLKGLPMTAAASTITELFEINISHDGTSLRKVELK